MLLMKGKVSASNDSMRMIL